MSHPISSLVLHYVQNWGYISFLCNVCFIICPSVSHCFFLPIYFISTAVILLESLAVIVQFSVSFNKAGSTSVLYNFILVVFEVFCGETHFI